MTNPWLTEARAAVERYRNGEAYRQFPPPRSSGYCARAARALYAAVKGKPFLFSQIDKDKDGDVDAMDMMALERAAGYACDWQTALSRGFVKPGARIYLAERGKDHGHVCTVIDGDQDKEPWECFRVLENTSSRKRGPGTVISLLGDVLGGRTPAAVGHYGV